MPTTPTFDLPYPASTAPFNVPGDLQALAQQLEAFLVPVGSILHTVASSAPTGWLFHNQTVANGQTLYPKLWAVLPASWKSGSSIVIPNLADSVLIQQNTTALGGTGGANSRTIASANLPTHQHTIDHDHGVLSLNINNDGTDLVTRETAFSDGGFGTGIVDTDLNPDGLSMTSGLVYPPAGMAVNYIPGHGHSGSVTVPNYTGNTGNGGFANSALDTTPKHLAVNFIIKAA